MDTQSTYQDEHQDKSIGKPIERLSSHVQGTVIPLDSSDSSMATNLSIVEEAIEEIGFRKFQWQLTLLCGFGFLVDQVRELPPLIFFPFS